MGSKSQTTCMFDPDVLAKMELPDDIAVGEAIDFIVHSEGWKELSICYPTAIMCFRYSNSRASVDRDMTMGEVRRLIREGLAIVSIENAANGDA
jgi:hypothetical protein